MAVNWGLAQGGNNALALFQVGAQMGQNLVARREAREQQNALLGLRQQEMDATLAERQRTAAEAERKRAQEAQITDLRRRVAGGDASARQELAALDQQYFSNFTEEQRKQAETARTALAEAAFDLIQTPDPAQQAAKWDAYAQRFQRPDLVGQFSIQRLNEIVAEAGLQQEFQKFQQPDYVPVGENGLQGFRYGQPLPQSGATPSLGDIPPPPPGFQLDEGGPGGAPSGASFPERFARGY